MTHDTHSVALTADDIAGLAALAGSTRGALSPLPAGSADGDAGTRLAGKGVTDGKGLVPPWDEAVTALRDPAFEVKCTAGQANLLCSLHAYGGIRESMTGFTPQESSGARLAHPVRPADLVEFVLAGLNLGTAVADPAIAVDLTTDGLVALAGAVDAVREAELRSLLKRDALSGAGVGFLDLWAALERGLMADDFRWGSAVIRLLIPGEMMVTQETVQKGLAELVRVGWLTSAEGTWHFTDKSAPALMQLMTPVNYASFSVRQNRAGSIERLDLVGIRSTATLWAIEFRGPGTAAPAVRLVTTTAERLGRAMLRALEAARASLSPVPPPPSEAPSAGPPVAAPRFCAQCGAGVMPDDRFCSACGAAVKKGSAG